MDLDFYNIEERFVSDQYEVRAYTARLCDKKRECPIYRQITHGGGIKVKPDFAVDGLDENRKFCSNNKKEQQHHIYKRMVGFKDLQCWNEVIERVPFLSLYF